MMMMHIAKAAIIHALEDACHQPEAPPARRILVVVTEPAMAQAASCFFNFFAAATAIALPNPRHPWRYPSFRFEGFGF